MSTAKELKAVIFVRTFTVYYGIVVSGNEVIQLVEGGE